MSETSSLTYLGWSEDVEALCKDIENNASKLSFIHKHNYLYLHQQQKYFKIPIIILSSCNSIFAVGLNAYLTQDLVSSINCILSLICSIISSIELYINLQKRIENEYKTLFNDSLVNNREIEDKLLIINKNVFSNPLLNGVSNNKLLVKTSGGEQSENSTV